MWLNGFFFRYDGIEIGDTYLKIAYADVNDLVEFILMQLFCSIKLIQG